MAPVGGKRKATDDEAGEVFAHAAPSALLPASPAPSAAPLVPASLQTLIDQELVRVIHAERGRSVQVDLGDTPVLVVPL